MNMITFSGKETSATHAAYRAPREMILTGVLPEGEKLKTDELRTRLDLGASPVREALSLLTSDMLVERFDQRGFRAAPASLADFEDILNLRCALEDGALRQSIARASSDWEGRLVLAHHRMNRALGQPDFEEAHRAFHMTLIGNAGSPMLERFCSQLYDLNIRYRYLAASGTDYRRRDISAEHEDILNAVMQRHDETASKTLLSHYRLTGTYLATGLSNLRDARRTNCKNRSAPLEIS